MLHITNGDSVVSGFRNARLPGDYLAWRDVLHDGPVPARDSLESLSDVRAAYLAGAASGATYDALRSEFANRDRALAACAGHDEVVLWFEHDLYDQLQLLQILSWIAGHDVSPARVSLIQIGSHPEVPNFQGLGQLTGIQLTALFPSRAPVTDAHFAMAQSAWTSFTADDPTSLSALARHHSPEMPFLSSAIARWLEEYPSDVDGLTRTERQLLAVIAAGATTREAIWRESQQLESAWWADASVYRRLDAMADAKSPLVARVDADRLVITDGGRRVLDGHDRHDPRQIDRWLGGVHLGAEYPDWRWHEGDGLIIAR